MPGYSEYETLKIEQKYCEDKADFYKETKDLQLERFYRNAAKGFEEKAKNLSLAEAAVRSM